MFVNCRKKLSESLSYGQSLNNNQALVQILNGLSKIFVQQARESLNIMAAANNINNNAVQVTPELINASMVISDPNHPNNPVKLLKVAKETSNSALTLAHHMGDVGAQLISLRALKSISFTVTIPLSIINCCI